MSCPQIVLGYSHSNPKGKEEKGGVIFKMWLLCCCCGCRGGCRRGECRTIDRDSVGESTLTRTRRGALQPNRSESVRREGGIGRRSPSTRTRGKGQSPRTRTSCDERGRPIRAIGIDMRRETDTVINSWNQSDDTLLLCLLPCY